MPEAYAVEWPKYERRGLEDAKTHMLKIAVWLPIVISDQIQSGCRFGRVGCEL